MSTSEEDTSTRRYRFTMTVDVEPGHPAFDDPAWVADAAGGSLTNEYDLRATYSTIEEVVIDHPI